MNSFSPKELETLIKLEAEGKLTAEDLYKRCALKTIQNQDNYVGSAIAHIIVGAICVGIGGTMVAPVFVALWVYSWFKSFKSRSAAIRRVNAGEFIDFLEPEDRVSYEQDMKATQTLEVPAQPQTKVPAPTSPAAATPLTGLPQETIDRTVSDAVKDSPVAPQTPQQTLFQVVADNPKSSFFAAPARVGKGIVITGCIRTVQKRVQQGTLGSVIVWALTPKQDPKEHWYWETCNKFYNPDIENGDRLLAARGIYYFLSDFGKLYRSAQEPTILVVDELTRLVGLLRGIKMEAVDPDLFGGDSQSFSDWLIDKIILSASMSQSVGYYVWVATPSSTVGNRGFSKGDAESLNVYTLATKHNLKFADGGNAAFSAPKTEENHPVFALGFSAGYCHQTKRWYPVPNMGEAIQKRDASPVQLTNYWTPLTSPFGHGESISIATLDDALTLDDVLPQTSQRKPKPILKPKAKIEPPKKKVEKPTLSEAELSKSIDELRDWIEQRPDIPVDKIYGNYNAARKGFSRPEFNYLLRRIGKLTQ